jgi:hypothetical protein
MTKKIALVVFSLLVFGCLSWAADKTYYGTVSCSHCGAMHATAGDAAAKCVEHCVSGGASYVLVSHGKVYKLDAQDKFKGGELSLSRVHALSIPPRFPKNRD